MVSDARVRSGMEVDPWLVGFNVTLSAHWAVVEAFKGQYVQNS